MGSLEEYAENLAKKGGVKNWRPPVLGEFAHGKTILSFDQSLSNTGWVRIGVTDSGVTVFDQGTIRTVSQLKGAAQSFHRMRQLRVALMRQFPTDLYDGIVVEMPALFGHRVDSSLMAASVLDNHWFSLGSPIELISIQHSRTVLCGTAAKNRKDLGHKGLINFIPASADRPWNEHQRDAALNGLAHLWDLRQMENDHE